MVPEGEGMVHEGEEVCPKAREWRPKTASGGARCRRRARCTGREIEGEGKRA